MSVDFLRRESDVFERDSIERNSVPITLILYMILRIGMPGSYMMIPKRRKKNRKTSRHDFGSHSSNLLLCNQLLLEV